MCFVQLVFFYILFFLFLFFFFYLIVSMSNAPTASLVFCIAQLLLGKVQVLFV